MNLNESEEVVVWPSFWRTLWTISMPLQFFLWSSVLIGVAVVFLMSGGRFPPGFFPIPHDTVVGLMLVPVAVILYGLIVGVLSQYCNRVRMSAEGIRPPSGAKFRGQMVYPWKQITDVELVTKWYGQWLLVSTARKRFFYLPIHVADPGQFIEAAEWFAGPEHPLVLALRRYARAWWPFPFAGGRGFSHRPSSQVDQLKLQ